MNDLVQYYIDNPEELEDISEEKQDLIKQAVSGIQCPECESTEFRIAENIYKCEECGVEL